MINYLHDKLPLRVIMCSSLIGYIAPIEFYHDMRATTVDVFVERSNHYEYCQHVTEASLGFTDLFRICLNHLN